MGRRRIDQLHRPFAHHPAHLEPVREHGLGFAPREDLDLVRRPRAGHRVEVLHALAENVHGTGGTQELLAEAHQRLPVTDIAHHEPVIGRSDSAQLGAGRAQVVPTAANGGLRAATITANLEQVGRCGS